MDDNDEGDGSDKTMDLAVEELLKLAGEVKIKGELMANEEDKDDNHKGWIDKCEELSEDELRDLSISIALVRLLLTKVRLQIRLLNY